MLKFVIITPVKNEEKNIEKTINSLINQTYKPQMWIIVNDGSTDKTVEIINKYKVQFPWISVIDKQKTAERRRRGQGVVEAFYVGYDKIRDSHFDLIIKLDGDLILPYTFFEEIIHRFQENPKLGMASGQELVKIKGKWQKAKSAKNATYGTTKCYRKTCFNDIGGLVPHMGWDGIDQIMADMKGWDTLVFENLEYYHLRPMGKETGLIKTAFEEGLGFYFMGYHPFFFILKVCKKLVTKPYVIGGICMLVAYFKSVLLRKERFENKEFIKYLRKNQIKRIINFDKNYI